MRIVLPWDVYSPARLGWSCFVFGLLLFIPLVFLLMLAIASTFHLQPPWTLFSNTVQILLGAGSLLICPLIGLVRWRIHLYTQGRRLWAALAATTGMHTPILVISLIGAAHSQPRMLLVWLSIHVAHFAVWSLVGLAAWPWIFRKWPFMIQYGESCPRCGYCVRGVTSRICPECGRAFSQFDLGLSNAEFERLIAGAG